MIRKIFFLCLIIFPLFACAQAEKITEPKEKIYPPYPDVWGYDLSEYPAFKWGGGDIEAYRMEDGDVWFLVLIDYKTGNPIKERGERRYLDRKYVLLKFFKKELIELSYEEMITLAERFREKRLYCIAPQVAHFKSGNSIKSDYDPSPKLCRVPDFIRGHLFKIKSNGSKEKYTILAASPQVEIFQDRARCEAQGAPFIYQKLYFLPNCLIDLGDDTFLTFSGDSNLILRFDENLNTRFQSEHSVMIQGEYINRNFFVMDYSIIDDLKNKFISEPIPLYQTIHNELLLYLNEKYDPHKGDKEHEEE